MKFSSSLKFNAVSEWWDEYIAYDALKKYIYQLERQKFGDGRPYHDMEASEYATLLGPSRSDTDSLFKPLLNQELKKIVTFYETQETELLEDLKNLEEHAAQLEEAGLAAGERYLDDDDDDDDDDDESISHSPVGRRRRSTSFRRPSRARSATTGVLVEEPTHRLSVSSFEDGATDHEAGATGIPRSPTLAMGRLVNKFGSLRDSTTSSVHDTIWTSQTDYAYDTRLLFKRKITNLYISLSSLKSYVEINHSGFRKILKKYDNVTDSELKDRYMHDIVEAAGPFRQESKDRINDALRRLTDLYAKCVTRGDRTTARQQLRLYQRENIAWERDTVWRQMIAQERRGHSEGEPTAIASLLKKPGPGLFYIKTPVGKIRVTKKMLWKIASGALFVLLLNVKVVDGVEANRCFAILVLCSVLWASEAIPLFVTSMFVPLLLILLRVIRDDKGERLSTPDATKWVYHEDS